MARRHGLSRQQFARRFCAAAGLPPKLFARITRFQALVHALLSTDVSQWASVSTAVGFYDQAHMITSFVPSAGSPPTIFFRPHGSDIDPAKIQLCGRPSEWCCADPSRSLRTNPSLARDNAMILSEATRRPRSLRASIFLRRVTPDRVIA